MPKEVPAIRHSVYKNEWQQAEIAEYFEDEIWSEFFVCYLLYEHSLQNHNGIIGIMGLDCTSYDEECYGRKENQGAKIEQCILTLTSTSLHVVNKYHWYKKQDRFFLQDSYRH